MRKRIRIRTKKEETYRKRNIFSSLDFGTFFSCESGDFFLTKTTKPERQTFIKKTIEKERFFGIALICKLIVSDWIDRVRKTTKFLFFDRKTSLYSFRLEKGNSEDIFEHSLRIW